MQAKLAELIATVATLTQLNHSHVVTMFRYQFRSLQDLGLHEVPKDLTYFGGLLIIFTFCQWMKAESSIVDSAK
jgi:hypothetical protein